MKKIDGKTAMMGLQLIMMFILVGALIFSAFQPWFLKVCEIICGLTLLVIAYNNKTMFNRKFMTVIYAFFGIFMIGMGIWNIVNG